MREPTTRDRIRLYRWATWTAALCIALGVVSLALAIAAAVR